MDSYVSYIWYIRLQDFSESDSFFVEGTESSSNALKILFLSPYTYTYTLVVGHFVLSGL